MVATADAPGGHASNLRLWTVRLLPTFSFVVLFLVWELTTTLGIIDDRALSSPRIVLAHSWEWIVTGYIWPHILATTVEVALGYVLGTALGLFIAFLFFFSPRLAALFDPFINVLNAVPRSILAPLFVVMLGIGLLSKVVLVILAVFLITLLSLYAGLKQVDQTLVNNTRVMGASQWLLIRHVYLPASLVWIVTAMRISIGHAFTVAIVCELMGATQGLGWLIAAGQASMKPEWMMSALLFASVLTLLIDRLILSPLEARGSHWKVF